MAFTASCRALCLLLCRKLEIPSYVKSIKPEINDVIMPLFSFLTARNYGKITSISLFKMLCAEWLNKDICSL